MTADRLGCEACQSRTIGAAVYARRFGREVKATSQWLCSSCWSSIPKSWRAAYARLRRLERRADAPLPECSRMWARLIDAARRRVGGEG